MTCQDRRNVSNLSRSVLLESVQSSGDEEIDLSLFSATLKEVEKGFIKGPVYRQRGSPSWINTHQAFSCETEEQSETHRRLQGVLGKVRSHSKRRSHHTYH